MLKDYHQMANRDVCFACHWPKCVIPRSEGEYTASNYMVMVFLDLAKSERDPHVSQRAFSLSTVSVALCEMR